MRDLCELISFGMFSGGNKYAAQGCHIKWFCESFYTHILCIELGRKDLNLKNNEKEKK